MKCKPRHPVEFEYFRFNVDPTPEWFSKRVKSGDVTIEMYESICAGPFGETHPVALLRLPNHERIFAEPGDYVVLHPFGDIRFCDEEIFNALYEIVEEEQ